MKMDIQTNTCTHMFVAALFTMGKGCRQAKYLMTDEWISKYGLFTQEYNSVFKRKDALMYATMWLSLQNIVLSLKSQSSKGPYCNIPFIGNVQNRCTLTLEAESRLVVARSWEEELG